MCTGFSARLKWQRSDLYIRSGVTKRRKSLPVIAADDNRKFGIEGDVGEFGALLGGDHLLAERLVLVDVQVEDVHLKEEVNT